MTQIHFTGILSGKESEIVVPDNNPITIQEGQ